MTKALLKAIFVLHGEILTGFKHEFKKQLPKVFYKKAVLKTLHSKTLVLESLFNKFAGLQAGNFITERLRHGCFPVNIVKFLKKHSKF